MMDSEWYAPWRREALQWLQDGNEKLEKQFKLSTWPRYDYDMTKRQLMFSEEERTRVIADIQIVGSTSQKAGNWFWAWANSHWSHECIEDARRVYSFGERNNIEELTSRYVEDDDLNALGWELTAVAARICDVAAAYRPHGDGWGLFLLCRNMRWVV